MVHGRGYRVFSSTYCCNCSRKSNSSQQKSSAITINREISSPCYTPVAHLPVLGKDLGVKMSKDSAYRLNIDNLPILPETHNVAKDLDENDNKSCSNEMWKQIVNKHDHERMEKEVKKLEKRIRNLGKVHSRDSSSLQISSTKSHKYTKSHFENRPKCTFL